MDSGLNWDFKTAIRGTVDFIIDKMLSRALSPNKRGRIPSQGYYWGPFVVLDGNPTRDRFAL